MPQEINGIEPILTGKCIARKTLFYSTKRFISAKHVLKLEMSHYVKGVIG
jgi:hypothetical protein